MVRSLESRVKRLEKAAGGGWNGPPCGECGWGGGNEPDDFEPGDTYEIVFDDEPVEEYCPACDRRVNIVVTWADEEDLGQ